MAARTPQEGFVVGSAHAAWPDPPWRITGRTLTAWFSVPEAVLAASMPSYLRAADTSPMARLRFYDARFESLSHRDHHPLVPRSGVFREAVVAFPAHVDPLEGDATMFMWADDDVYRTWGREVYGWPILPGTVELEGTLWQTPLRPSATGSAQLFAPVGKAAIDEATVLGPAESSAAGWWLTPRRILDLRSPDADDAEETVVAVRPFVAKPGVAFRAQGAVEFDFARGHPLHGLIVEAEQLLLVDGFELIVPSDVVIIRQTQTPPS